MPRATGKLRYSEDWYQPYNLRESMRAGNIKEIRKEYTRLRDISQKRLKRMSQTIWRRSQTFKRNVSHYPKLADIKSESELAARLSDLSRFIMSQSSTVSGQEQQMKKSLKTLHENEGYEFVTKENYLEFGEFMEEYRFQRLDEEYDSGDAAETFNVLEAHRVDPSKVKEDFEFWLSNREILEQLPEGKGGTILEKTLKNRLIKYADKKHLKVQE